MQSTIWTDGLALQAKRGPVYGPVSLDIGPGVTVLCGPSGSGRTSMLLTLAGRMKQSSGSGEVLGHSLPGAARRVQKRSAIAGFDGIDSLEESVSVGAAVHERESWIAPWWKFVSKPSDRRFAAMATPIFGRAPLPKVSDTIWDLTELQSLLLRITLAMLSNPEVLFVDQIEQLHESASRRILWESLAAIAERGTVVVVAATAGEPELWTTLRDIPTVIAISEEN